MAPVGSACPVAIDLTLPVFPDRPIGTIMFDARDLVQYAQRHCRASGKGDKRKERTEPCHPETRDRLRHAA